MGRKWALWRAGDVSRIVFSDVDLRMPLVCRSLAGLGASGRRGGAGTRLPLPLPRGVHKAGGGGWWAIWRPDGIGGITGLKRRSRLRTGIRRGRSNAGGLGGRSLEEIPRGGRSRGVVGRAQARAGHCRGVAIFRLRLSASPHPRLEPPEHWPWLSTCAGRNGKGSIAVT